METCESSSWLIRRRSSMRSLLVPPVAVSGPPPPLCVLSFSVAVVWEKAWTECALRKSSSLITRKQLAGLGCLCHVIVIVL
jgi:hypothetical protein